MNSKDFTHKLYFKNGYPQNQQFKRDPNQLLRGLKSREPSFIKEELVLIKMMQSLHPNQEAKIALEMGENIKRDKKQVNFKDLNMRI